MVRREDDLPTDYRETLREIKERIHKARYTALQAVNKELIELYWDIGKTIVERQEADPGSWGKAVVKRLSMDLQREFQGLRGFSSSNLWRMRTFYDRYHKNEKLASLVREICWTHNLHIMEKCKNNLERKFYILMTRKFNWPKQVLIEQIKNKAYERTMLNQTNFETTLPNDIRDQAHLSVKDEYTFEFLEMGDEQSERQFEKAILGNLPSFLKEMGGVFTYVDNQFRFEVEGHEYFIDLLLFHRRMKCLVAIELKIGKFKPEYVGKMQFYLSALDELIREKDENPSIGIILCKDKGKTTVEYTLRGSNKPIGVSNYRTLKQLPSNLKDELPSAEQIEKLLKSID